jgi:hypothetical protein
MTEGAEMIVQDNCCLCNWASLQVSLQLGLVQTLLFISSISMSHDGAPGLKKQSWKTGEIVK